MSRLGACPLACQQFLIDIQPSTSTNKVASETHGHEVVRIVRVAMFEYFFSISSSRPSIARRAVVYVFLAMPLKVGDGDLR